MEKKRIRLLSTKLFGNHPGEIVSVRHETEGEVYYYDGFHRYCYLNKTDEGTDFEWVDEGD